MTTGAQLRDMMQMFIERKDRPVDLAGQIEVALEELFGETEPFLHSHCRWRHTDLRAVSSCTANTIW